MAWLFDRNQKHMKLEQEHDEAKFQLKCERARSVVLELKEKLTALQRFAEAGKNDIAVFAAGECCKNPIIASLDQLNRDFPGFGLEEDIDTALAACGNSVFPYADPPVLSPLLRKTQIRILDAARQFYPGFQGDPQAGLFGIAADGQISELIAVCVQESRWLSQLNR